jgi:hypothetical protein
MFVRPRNRADCNRVREETMAQCGHCYQHVMFKQDGSCPACGKSPQGAAPRDPNRRLTVIGVHQTLPSCCILCGRATERRQRKVYWYDIVESRTLLEKFMSRLPGNERRKAHRVTLPICENCEAASGQLKPQSVRFGVDYRMLTHREFATRFEALNGPPESEPT